MLHTHARLLRGTFENLLITQTRQFSDFVQVTTKSSAPKYVRRNLNQTKKDVEKSSYIFDKTCFRVYRPAVFRSKRDTSEFPCNVASCSKRQNADDLTTKTTATKPAERTKKITNC